MTPACPPKRPEGLIFIEGDGNPFSNPLCMFERKLVTVAQLSNGSLALQYMTCYSGIPMQQGSHS